MADNGKFYVIRGDKVLIESMTKEEIHNAIVQAVEQGEIGDIDKGFITSIKEQNRNVDLKVWRGTYAEYNALQSIDPNTHYIITDENFKEQLNTLTEQFASFKDYMIALMQNHDTKINALANATFYYNDVTAVELNVNGYVTGGGTIIRFALPKNKEFYTGGSIPRPDSDPDWDYWVRANNIEDIAFDMKARQSGNYVIGSSSSSEHFGVDTNDRVSWTVNDEAFNIEISLQNAPADIINNAEIALNLSGLRIYFNR